VHFLFVFFFFFFFFSVFFFLLADAGDAPPVTGEIFGRIRGGVALRQPLGRSAYGLG